MFPRQVCAISAWFLQEFGRINYAGIAEPHRRAAGSRPPRGMYNIDNTKEGNATYPDRW